jgi:hypothetical protein
LFATKKIYIRQQKNNYLQQPFHPKKRTEKYKEEKKYNKEPQTDIHKCKITLKEV